MTVYIGCDAHKRYSVFRGVDEKGQAGTSHRVENSRGIFRGFLTKLPAGSPIAVETIGNWYWLVDEIERAGHNPHLTASGKAKLMMGQINKTDKLDAKGLAILLRNGTLPEVWIPPGELRDQRELPRTRMMLVQMRTRLKNRIHATLEKYAVQIDGVSDLFGVKGRELVEERLKELPPFTQESMKAELRLLDDTNREIALCERRIKEIVAETPEMQLLMTMPGVGALLAVVLALEIGDVERFGGPEQLASYSGTVPRVHSSGGKTYHGQTRPDVNRYLKWALVEAANCIVLHQSTYEGRHAVRLYSRIRDRRGHGKAVVAVARHLAEASYWMLKKKEPYQEPSSSTREQTR